MPIKKEHQKSRQMKWLRIGGLAAGVLLIGVIASFIWRTIAESRRIRGLGPKQRAELFRALVR